MSLSTWAESTPIVTDRDNTSQFDILKSLYTNLRYNFIIQQVYTVQSQYEANLPGLAYDFYGDQNFWRVILIANGLSDPISDIVTGMSLVLPTSDSILSYLGRTSTNSNSNTPTVTI